MPVQTRLRRSAIQLFARGAVVLTVLFCACAQAQGETTYDQARQLMAAQNAAGAYALLEPLERQRAGQPEFDYLLGIAALDSGRISRAIFALERVLAVQPDNALARAEIGRAYLAAGEAENARSELTQVRSGTIPASALPAVDRLLGAISQLQSQQSTQLRGYLEAGLGYDTNVNSATGSSQVAIPSLGGLTFTLDPASRRLHDTLATLGAGANLRVPIDPELAFAGNIALNRTFNENQARFDFGTLDASAGLARSAGKHVFSAALQATANWLDASRFREAYGVLGQWQYNLDSRAQTTVFAQATRLEYPGNPIRDANRAVLGAGYARALASGPVIYVSAYGGREDARATGVPQLSHRLAGLRAGAQWQTGGNLTMFAALSGEERRYGGDEPLFGFPRRDRQSGLVAGAIYALAQGWRLTPQVSVTDNESNVAIYQFRRIVTSLTLRREF
jgi:outer membrane protein